MPFTYDITTDRGKVRFLSTDSDIANQVFSDDEIDACIAMAPVNNFAAAALVCETWARSRSKLALSLRQTGGTITVRYQMSELLALAASLRDAALSSRLVTGQIVTAEPNELLDSYRPTWRGLTDIPIVE